MSSDENSSKKRIRVSKACNNCRKKKIKCDGATQCSNCASSNKSCLYSTDEERRARITKGRIESKLSKAESIKELQKRMGNVETLLSDFLEKAEIMTKGSTASIGDGRRSQTGSQTVERSSDTEREKTGEVDTESEKAKQDKTSTISGLIDHYHGSHSLFNIFSTKSINWIKQKLSDEDDKDVWAPIANLPTIFEDLMKPFVFVFSQSDNYGWKNADLLFRDNKALIYDILKYYPHIFLVNAIVENEEIKRIFDRYYESKEKKSKKIHVGNDDLFLMSLALNLCMDVAVSHLIAGDDDGGRYSHDIKPPVLAKYNFGTFSEIRLNFINLLFFCYSKVSIVGTSIRRIQGILLFIVFMETGWIECSGNFTLVALAVRYAQEVGLNRFESFSDLPCEQQWLRRRLWSFCQYFDQEICYRSGKPPIVNQADVTTLTHMDPFLQDETNMEALVNFSCYYKTIDHSAALSRQRVSIGSFFLHLNRIRAESYASLFNASARFSSPDELFQKIDYFNDQLFRQAETLEDMSRPRFYNDPQFEFNTESLELEFPPESVDNVLLAHYTFFVHLMIINRLPSLISNELMEANFMSLKLKNYFLDSARTILHLRTKFDKHRCQSSFGAWTSFYPSVAFLVLIGNCLNNQNSPETFQDTLLLIDFSLKCVPIWVHKKDFTDFKTVRGTYDRESMMDFICRVMLSVLLRVSEKKNGFSFISRDPKLKEHLEATKKIWPFMFQRVQPSNRGLNFKFHDFETFSGTKNPSTTNSTPNIYNDLPPDLISSRNSYGTKSTSRSNLNSPDGSFLPPDRQDSRSKDPLLSNIVNPENDSIPGLQDSSMSEYMNDLSLQNLLYSQVNSMPNFFFGNT